MAIELNAGMLERRIGLRRRFRHEFHAKVSEIEKAWMEASRNGSKEALREMHRGAHTLAGSGESLGFDQVCELARIIDVAILPAVEGEERIGSELREMVRGYLTALKNIELDGDEALAEQMALQEQAKLHRPEGAILAYVLENDINVASDVARQIDHFGYEAVVVSDLDELLQLTQERPPHVFIMSVDLQQSELSSSSVVAQLRDAGAKTSGVVFIADEGNIESRLMAARAGADAYFTKPLDIPEVVDKLDQLTGEVVVEPLNIIVVDDSSTQSTYYASVLERAGMHVTVLNDPLRILDEMRDNPTDLVLVDMYMPECSGVELAKVIRQAPIFASIPIVFLSAETEIDRQLDAMSFGGDDFLVKPIAPDVLIRSVSHRAERARILRSFMIRDNLTGLLNHTRIKEQLDHEVARSDRQKGHLSFVMLDIDHFKSVNDTHGHHVGDRVIKSLARVLQQRLRRSDSIGRYGGEEFAVVLPEVGGESALEIMNEIRDTFKDIKHHSSNGDFSVSFSAGIATLANFSDAEELALEADKALYKAKEAGRDCVVLATK